MPNSYYNHSTYPAPNAPGSSAALRAELDLVTAGFNLLPTLSGNGYKVAMVNAAGTALIASSALQNLTIDNSPIGATTASTGRFTTVTTTAASGFFGNLVGNVTGDVTSTGTSTFNNVTISGALDMQTLTAGTISGLNNPTNSSDAANKGYVDTQDALRLSLSGGTMSGNIAMGTNRITGMADPSSAQDAATKNYIDTVFGSTTSAAASAAAAATSATNAANSATAAATSASNASTSASNAASSYTTFNNQYLGAKASDPSVNNTGGALVTGNLYWNSTANQMRVYDGAAWNAAYLPVAGYLPLSGGTMTGNLGFSGSGLRLTGDFSNGTLANRLAIQTSTTNGDTGVFLLPNGTAQIATLRAYNASDPTNSAYAQLQVNATAASLVSAASGSGTALPLLFSVGATEVARATTTANLLVGTTTDNATDKVQVNGTIKSLSGGFVFPDDTTQTTAAVSSGVFSATAKGAITANKPCILNSDGTVSEIVVDSGTVGSEQTFLPSSFQIVGGQMLDLGSNNFAVLAVEIATSYIGIVIVTLSGTNLTTVSFGSFQALSTSYFWQGASPTGLYGAQMIYDAANNKIIFATQTGAWRGGPFGFTRYPSLGVIVCTISGTTITPGSMYTFTINDITGRQSGGTGYATIVWDSTQNRLIYIYQNSDDISGRYTQYQMMSISGTVVSLVTGQTDLSPTVIAVSSDYSNEAIVYEANINRILWWTWRAGTYTLRMFSNNGSTITEVTNSATTTFAPNTAKLIPGSSGLITSGTNSSGYPTGWPFSVTASTITPGTQTVLNSAIAANGTFAAINRVSPNSGVIFYSIGSTMYAKAISSLSTSLVTITVPSGTNNVSFGAIDTQNTYGFSNSASRALKISRYFSGSYGLKAVAGNAIGSNLYSSTQFIGFSSAAASNGENVNIATMGAQISGQSSLTLPNLYYVQTDGTLSTTAGTPSVLAGYAVSSNTIIVKGTGS